MGKKTEEPEERTVNQSGTDLLTELGVEQAEQFTARGRGAWDEDGIIGFVNRCAAQFSSWKCSAEGFVNKFHQSGPVKYAGYYAKKKQIEAGEALGMKLVGKTDKKTVYIRKA